MQHYREHKDVAFYADKLCITSKYLSMVIKEASGKTAKDWIVEYAILEIKAMLKNSTMNIQEISIKKLCEPVVAGAFLESTQNLQNIVCIDKSGLNETRKTNRTVADSADAE